MFFMQPPTVGIVLAAVAEGCPHSVFWQSCAAEEKHEGIPKGWLLGTEPGRDPDPCRSSKSEKRQDFLTNGVLFWSRLKSDSFRNLFCNRICFLILGQHLSWSKGYIFQSFTPLFRQTSSSSSSNRKIILNKGKRREKMNPFQIFRDGSYLFFSFSFQELCLDSTRCGG